MGGTREWCVVLDAVSPGAAHEVGRVLAGEGADVDIESKKARVWCFASTEAEVRILGGRVLDLTAADEWLQIAPKIRAWNESLHRYVDPAVPDEDPDTG